MAHAIDRSGTLTGFMLESVNTLTASRWELLKVRLFGKRHRFSDSWTTVTVAEYRGKVYFLNFSEDHPHD